MIPCGRPNNKPHTHECLKRRNPQRANLPGANIELVAGRGRQRGEQTDTGTEAYAGTRSGAQGQAVESGDVQLGKVFHHEKKWGRKKKRGLQRGTAADGEEVGKRGEIMIQKTAEEKGGTGGIF